MRVLSDAKRQDIVRVAGEVFLEEGYAVSMDLIAGRIGCSKATLYRYFSSKEELFCAFVTARGESFSTALAEVSSDATEIRAGLISLGQRYLSLVLSAEIMAIGRLVVAEIQRFPELSNLFFENGPRMAISMIEAALVARQARGDLQFDDPQTVALQFQSLCLAGVYERAVWGMPSAVPGVNRHIETAVDTFLTVYGVGKTVSASASG